MPLPVKRNHRGLAVAAFVIVATLLLFANRCASPASPVAVQASASPAISTPAVAPGVGREIPVIPSAVIPSATPFQIRTLAFAMTTSEVQLTGSIIVRGRTKASPRSVASDRLEFEVIGHAGRQTYAGSIDHPLRRSFEVEEPDNGRLRRVESQVAEAVFQVRLPEPLDAVRIIFYEIGAANGFQRQRLAEVDL